MSAGQQKQGTYEEQLSALENRLKVQQQDEAMLGEVGLAMNRLLERNGGSEAHIRQILERQFDQGNLRRESYELVEKLLGKIIAERAARRDAPSAETPYVETEVLDAQQAPPPPRPPSAQPEVGAVLRDRYLLKEQVAEGSMGTVFKALDRRLAETGDENPYVAIKVLSPKLSRNGNALRALQQEAAKGRCLAHPNIVRFIDLDRENDLFFIVMEWLEGRSLARILDDNRGSSLDFNTAMNIVRQTSRALGYAHQRGVIHADIKPGNIMITPEGHVKLIDFGVARIRQKENEGKGRFDPAVMRAGSPAYSSMQVLTGEDPVPADDVFSLACLMYRLIAGYRVFGPRNAADAAEEGMEPQQPQELDAHQWSALKKALSYSRVTRYQTPQEFMDAFGQSAPAKPKATRSAPAKPKAARPAPAQEPAATARPRAPMPMESGALQLGPDETTHVSADIPMRAVRETTRFDPDEDEPHRSPWRLAIAGLLVAAVAVALLRPDLVERLGLDTQVAAIRDYVENLASGDGSPGAVSPAPNARAPAADEAMVELDAIPDADVAPATVNNGTDNVVGELVIDTTDGSIEAFETAPAGTTTVDALPEPDIGVMPESEADASEFVDVDPLPPPIDFSVLPPPSVLLGLRSGMDGSVPSAILVVQEDSGAAIIDLTRTGDLADILEVRLVETRASSGESAASSGRYRLENDGWLRFDRGQPRARTTLTMASNDMREADGEVTLAIRASAAPERDLGVLRVTLEDDDQRAFESSLPVNTIGFAASEVVVREFDPAVQVDVVRYRPDNTAIEIPFTFIDVTATEGQDYFPPGLPVVYFGPGQKSARVLIPLGQDTRPEQSEVFRLQLQVDPPPANSNIYSQIAVMIRDDDS